MIKSYLDIELRVHAVEMVYRLRVYCLFSQPFVRCNPHVPLKQAVKLLATIDPKKAYYYSRMQGPCEVTFGFTHGKVVIGKKL